MKTPELTIVIPALNEGASIRRVLAGLAVACEGLAFEVIVVDDGSCDDTAAVAAECGARVLANGRTLGYGGALKSGIRAAAAPFVLTIDADGQHRPADVPNLWARRQEAELVVGARTGTFHSALWRMPGKWAIANAANVLSGTLIPDLNSGLRLFRRDTVLKYLHVCPQGFSFSTTITLAFHSRGWRVVYVPIEVDQRTGVSTVTVRTGFETLLLLLRIFALFNPLRIFLPASLVTGGAGLAWAIPFVVEQRGISVGSMLAIVTGVLLFGLGILCDQVSQMRLERFE